MGIGRYKFVFVEEFPFFWIGVVFDTLRSWDKIPTAIDTEKRNNKTDGANSVIAP